MIDKDTIQKLLNMYPGIEGYFIVFDKCLSEAKTYHPNTEMVVSALLRSEEVLDTIYDDQDNLTDSNILKLKDNYSKLEDLLSKEPGTESLVQDVRKKKNELFAENILEDQKISRIYQRIQYILDYFRGNKGGLKE